MHTSSLHPRALHTVIFFTHAKIFDLIDTAIATGVLPHKLYPTIFVNSEKDNRQADQLILPEGALTIVINGGQGSDVAKVLIKAFISNVNERPLVVFEFDGNGLPVRLY